MEPDESQDQNDGEHQNRWTFVENSILLLPVLALKWPQVMNANIYVASAINFTIPFYTEDWT